jgi:integrase
MTLEKDINTLTKECEAYLRKEGYSDARIRDYRRLWGDGIINYVEECSKSIYNTDIGEQFIRSIAFTWSASHIRALRRSVRVLSDFLLYGSIRKRIVQQVMHELPGEIGAIAKLFIACFGELRRSQLTLSEHQRVLSYFIKNLSLKSVFRVSEINEEHVLAFLSSAQNCKDKFLNTMRLFCRYLHSHQLVERNIEYVIGRNNLPKREKLPSVYDAKEIKQIEDAVDEASPVGKRDYAILLLASRLGFRSSDIAGLQFTNLDWDNNIIRLTQYKTKREVELPLLAEVGDAIINYLKYGRPVSRSQHVFLSACAPYRPINRLIINGAISRIIKSSKVDIQNRKFGPHSMRHTLASQLLSNGTSLPVISEALGHTNTQTTMNYIRIDIQNLQRCALVIPMVSQAFYNQKGGIFYE